ncbi:VWA domain-containing protein [Neorhodopirellula lusitana]|uniref:VWA domain-containing protein n=1 Tax=Neorhodopirellula lusitana TaxID=445327 RepID=UPI00384ECF22
MTPFIFQSPWILCLLLLLFPMAWLLHRARKRRNIVHAQMGGTARSSTHDWLRLAAFVLLIIALARPGIQPHRESISKTGRDVIFVLDVSQSMLAEDAYPSRLEAAKNGIRDALDRFRTERVALVIYAGSANILCPLTHDYDFAHYMLDQANPRAVDFGGTTLLSAMEKCVDNLLIESRTGMQDVVVLTDGEEHGEHNPKIAEQLLEHQVGLLLVGLGDPVSGSRIPIIDEEGATSYLKHEDQFVTTRLNDQGLLELSRLTARSEAGSKYIPAATSAFNLPDLYYQVASDKPVASTEAADSYVVYREIAFGFIAIALALLLIAERTPRSEQTSHPTAASVATNAATTVAILLGLLVSSTSLQHRVSAAEPSPTIHFADALLLQNNGQPGEAIDAYNMFETEQGRVSLSPPQLATLRYNQGLCYLAMADAQAEAEPRSAMSLAMTAQRHFLEACQSLPGFQQAAQNLDPTAQLIMEYSARIEQEEEEDKKRQQQMQDLVERLQELEQAQTELRDQVPSPPRLTAAQRRLGKTNSATEAPDNADTESKRFSQEQGQLQLEGRAILIEMQTIDQAITPPMNDDSTKPVSLLQEPLRLMNEVVAAQTIAATRLKQWNTWHDGREQQQVAIVKIQEILELLASDSDQDGDEGDWDEEDDYESMMEASDSEQAMMSSMQGQGDFASGSSMQSLPVPNYSVEDILMEEEGSLQFRQQQRAKSNEGKVEKNW